MSRTILDPQYANDLNGLFDGTGSLATGTITTGTITVGSGNNVCSIQSTAFNTLGIGGANSGDFVCGDITAANSITSPSVIGSTTVTVGSGSNVCSIQSPAFNTLGIGGSNGGDIVCGDITAANSITSPSVTGSITVTVGSGSSTCSISSSAFNTLSVGGSSSGIVACGSLTIAGRDLTVNSSGQLVWDGNVIS